MQILCFQVWRYSFLTSWALDRPGPTVRWECSRWLTRVPASRARRWGECFKGWVLQGVGVCRGWVFQGLSAARSECCRSESCRRWVLQGMSVEEGDFISNCRPISGLPSGDSFSGWMFWTLWKMCYFYILLYASLKNGLDKLHILFLQALLVDLKQWFITNNRPLPQRFYCALLK